jgi:hypothetical protein
LDNQSKERQVRDILNDLGIRTNKIILLRYTLYKTIRYKLSKNSNYRNLLVKRNWRNLLTFDEIAQLIIFKRKSKDETHDLPIDQSKSVVNKKVQNLKTEFMSERIIEVPTKTFQESLHDKRSIDFPPLFKVINNYHLLKISLEWYIIIVVKNYFLNKMKVKDKFWQSNWKVI